MVYLVCNAHLDPVWLWRWDEGAGEALSTFRAAADFLDETDGFVFNHNESLLYEWVEQTEPKLFKRIQSFVEQGRWHIIGGWFLQPDCNIPVGEAIVRQMLKGRRYFSKAFDKVPRTAVNFDSFGHARGLVQVMRQAGYDQYLVCRPGAKHYPFENPDFLWKGYDQSEILVHRSDENYNSVKGKVAEELGEWMDKHGEKDTLFLWGVGNHGGGPSRKDLQEISNLQRQGKALKHAVPEEYFSKLDRTDLPVVSEALGPLFEGCYTSQIRIKQLHRRLENDLLMVEKMAAHAALNNLSDYDAQALQEAWHDLLFAEFHDALPGTAIASAESDTLRTLNHGLEITAQLKARYFFALSAGEPKAYEGTVPLLVYNPHPFDIEGPLNCEFVLPQQNWKNEYSNPIVYQAGRALPSQSAKEEANFNMDWRKRVLWHAHLPASSMSRFDVRFEILPKRVRPTLEAKDGLITVNGPSSTLVVNTVTGLVDRYAVNGVDYLKKGALALQVFADSVSPWGNAFIEPGAKPIAAFVPMNSEEATAFSGVKGGSIDAVRVIEEGSVRVTVEALLEHNHSRVCQRYSLILESGELLIDTLVFFGEGEKCLKLSVPTAIKEGKYIGQTMFGREEMNTRRAENVSQYWTCVTDGKQALSVINDSIYGSDFVNGEARLTLLRSAGYSASTFVCGEPYHEAMFMPRIDQGERHFRFLLRGGPAGPRLATLDCEADAFNQQPYALAYCPSGQGEKPLPLLRVDAQNLRLSAFKRAEDQDGDYILRLYECQGIASDGHVDLPGQGLSQAIHFEPFQIRTFRMRGDLLSETTLLEGE